MKLPLRDNRNGRRVEGTVALAISAARLIRVEAQWLPYREQVRAWGSAPEHNDWNWARKGRDLRYNQARCIGITYRNSVQGLALISTTPSPSRLHPPTNETLLYVKNIEVTPWNLEAYVGANERFSGVGTGLLRVLSAISLETGCEGRLGLHSLPQAETFYDQWMTGVNFPGEGERYYEMSREQAIRIMEGINVEIAETE